MRIDAAVEALADHAHPLSPRPRRTFSQHAVCGGVDPPNPRSDPQTRLGHRASRSKVHQVTFSPSAGAPVRVEVERITSCDYRNSGRNLEYPADTGRCNRAGPAGLQSVFVLRLRSTLVCAPAGHTVRWPSPNTTSCSVVHRVGLRYIDVVRASGAKAVRVYRRDGRARSRGRSVPAWRGVSSMHTDREEAASYGRR